MHSIYLLTTPNIIWLKLKFYLEVFFIILATWLSLILLIYFILKYRVRKKIISTDEFVNRQTSQLQKQLIINKIKESSGQKMLILFVEYLQNFVTTKPHKSIQDLFIWYWLDKKEIENIQEVLYWQGKLGPEIERKIKENLKFST